MGIIVAMVIACSRMQFRLWLYSASWYSIPLFGTGTRGSNCILKRQPEVERDRGEAALWIFDFAGPLSDRRMCQSCETEKVHGDSV